ncbi:MAG: hypothetical protein DI589_06570 [Shinella sp.]|nr:MAG: hypothetical protein DI589_06570 [Shinella sp.]
MMNLPDPKDLRGSVSDGPMSWTEAFGKAAETTDETMRLIENGNADYYALEKAYDQRIAAIRDVTGQDLPNPMRVASAVDRDMAAVVAAQAGGGGVMPLIGEMSPDFRQRQEAEFNEKARALSGQYRQDIDQILSTSIVEDKGRVMRNAQAAAAKAGQAPELGAVGRLGAQIWGGLTGAANDPSQWGMAMIGGAGGSAKTVAGRIGQTMFSEALLNGGQELVLQGMSQERKSAAGLEHGMGDMLANAGVAATFGALFGGSVQGAGELWSALRARAPAGGAPAFPDVPDEVGTAAMARVIDGAPERGDVEIVAQAMGVELAPEKIDMLNRSFEERMLDDLTIRDDASPAEIRVYEAAQRYAEDPDNNPPPELLERMLAEQEAGRMRFSADEYERMFSGDRNAVDDIADTFFADDVSQKVGAVAERVDRMADAIADQRIRPERSFEPQDQASMRFAEEQAGDLAQPRRIGPFGPIFRADEFSGDWAASVRALQERDGGEIIGAFDHPDIGPIDAIWGDFDPTTPTKGFGLKKIMMKHPEVINRLPEMVRAMTVTQRSDNRIRLADANSRAVVRLDFDGEAKTWLFTAFEYDSRRTGKTTDRPGGLQESGHSSLSSSAIDNIGPDTPEGNVRDLMREPARDRNGNPENYLDFIGVEDGDGNISIMSAREALALADEPAFHADLLEACKL